MAEAHPLNLVVCLMVVAGSMIVLHGARSGSWPDLIPAMRVFVLAAVQDVNARDERGHDDSAKSHPAADVQHSQLNASDQDKHDHDDQDEAKPAAWIVTPAGGIRPRRQCADQQQYEQNDQQGAN